MSKNKDKKTKPVNSTDISVLAAPYLDRKKRFIDLDLTEPQGQSIAKYCLARRPGFIAEMDVNNPAHVNLLRTWVIENYSNYITIIRNGFDHADLLSAYLYRKFKATANDQCSVLRSYEKNTLLCYRYETRKGETIAYFDKALGVPSVLKVTADVKIKIVDPRLLIKSVDIDVAVVDLNLVMDYIDRMFNTALRDSILNYILEKDLSYYMLSQHYTQITKETKDAMKVIFDQIGLEILSIDILDIAIPNNTNEMFERQFFAISEAGRVKDFEHQQEKISLELYEKKAEIHSKYPEFPVTLTESEKDFALNRYMKRVGKDTALSADIESDELDEKEAPSAGTTTRAPAVRPTPPTMPISHFRAIYWTTFIISVVFSCLLAFASVGTFLISLGIVVLVFGIWGAAKKNALKTGVTKAAIEEYRRQYEDYQREYNNYLASKDENDLSR